MVRHHFFTKRVDVFKHIKMKDVLLLLLLATSQMACAQKIKKELPMDESITNKENLETTTLGAGCFWCIEAIFQELKGVYKVESGYMGGHVENPTYKAVCTGETGHAEVARITYDPNIISFKEILEVFWQTHDPTTLNRQGNDVGTQYRSAVFYHNESQKQIATDLKAKLDQSGAFDNPIVTEITEISTYYPAEDYHQNYYAQNTNQPYCAFVISPKMDKFRKVFADKLK